MARLPIPILFPEVLMGHPSTLKLHQLRYGELDADEAREIREHIRNCPLCAERFAAQQNNRAAFEIEPIPAAIRDFSRRPSLIERLLANLRRPILVGALAAAAALLFFINPFALEERSKGGLDEVEVVVEDYGVLVPGDTIRPGDRIQLRIPPGEWDQVWVGDGESWLGAFPTETSERWQLMDFSLRIDEQPGDETIVVVMSNHPISEGEANEALAGGFIAGVEVQEITLRKER